MIINGFKEVIINNGVNFGSFKGEPDGFVKLPVGSLFARQNYRYWKKLPSRPWEPYTELYYRPTRLEYEKDYNGKMWFKSNNGWLFVGEMEKGRAAGSPPPPLPPTMSMLFMDNVDFIEYVLDCGDQIEKSNVETDYIVSVSIYNNGESNLEISSASVINGDIAYRELNFDGDFPYTVQGGSSVGFEIVTNKNAVTQSFGADFYNSIIRIESNTGTCDFYVSSSFEISPVSDAEFKYIQTADDWTIPNIPVGQYLSSDGLGTHMWSLWVATSDTTRELVYTDFPITQTWDLTEFFSDPIVTDIPGNNKKFFITVNYVDSGADPTIEFPKNITIVSSEGDVTVENYSNMESKFSETGFEWAELRYDSDNSLAQIVNHGQWINVSDTTTCKVTIELTNLNLEPAPVNDNFEDAIEITYETCGEVLIITGSNVYATRQDGEPYPITSEDAEYVSASIHSVWWKWTPETITNGSASFDLVSSSYDTQIAIYTGSDLSNLEKIAFDDDYHDTFRSRVEFPFTTGVTYYIQVDGYYGETGDIDMRVNVPCPEEPCSYEIPDDLAEFGEGFLKGFADSDYTDVIWDAANTGSEGPATYAETIMLSDNGKYVLIGGPRFTTERKFMILERTGSNFITHEIDMTGINQICGIRRQSTSINNSDPLNHQIARNGIFVAGVNIGGSPSANPNASACWKDGFNNPPIINSNKNYYTWISDNGKYTLGHNLSNIPIRVNIETGDEETINESSYKPQAGNFCMDRIVGWSSIDLDERGALFTRSLDGVWTEEEGILVAHNVDPEVDFPSVNCMSGDGTKLCGEDSYGYAKALYWNLNQPPTGGYYQATVLPNPSNSASYGQSGVAEMISSDGKVISGYTEYGYPCFWSISDNFSTCYLLQDYLVANTNGPSTASINDGLPWSSGSYNTFGKFGVSVDGKHLVAIAEKQGSDSESMIYASPLNILSNPGFYHADDNFIQSSTGSNKTSVSGSVGWGEKTYIGYWGNDYGFDNFNTY